MTFQAGSGIAGPALPKTLNGEPAAGLQDWFISFSLGTTLIEYLLVSLIACALTVAWLAKRAKRADRTRRARDAAERIRKRVEHSNQASGDFLAALSHEMRTPLNTIIGFAELIEQSTFGPNAAQRNQDYARDITTSGHHLLNLVNDVLDLSKIESGHLEIKEQDIDVAATIHSSLRLLQHRADERKVELICTLPGKLPLLLGDERALRQVLFNLLSNAVRFTQEGGRVEVQARIGFRRGLVLSVSDTGIGMTKDEREEALLPFRQVGQSKHSGQGTGLGLSLSKRLTELHGGILHLESKPGAGTTANVILPAWRVQRSLLVA